MSLLHIDGFDHYVANNVVFPTPGGSVYAEINASSRIAPSTILGGQCWYCDTDNTAAAKLRLSLTTSYGAGNTLGVGFNLYASAYNNAAFTSSAHNVYFAHFGSVGGTRLFGVGTLAGASVLGNTLNIYSGTSTTPIASSILTLAPLTLYHIEMKMVIHASTGSIEVRVNGVLWVSATGLNTAGTAVQSVTFAQAVSGAGWCSLNYDNYYVWDGAGSVNNNWLGEQKVYTLFPSADTADADWTKSTGSDGYDLINDVPAVPATRYLEASVVGDVSIFDLGNLPTTSLIVKGVKTVVYAEKTDAAAGSLEFGPVHAATPSLVTIAQTNGSYRFNDKIDELNPSTGVAWLSTDINATQIELSRAA